MALKDWNRTTFGVIHFEVTEATSNINVIQEEVDNSGATNDLRDQEKAAQISLEKVLDTEEIFWQ